MVECLGPQAAEDHIPCFGLGVFAGLAVLANSFDRCMHAFLMKMLVDCQFCSGHTRAQKVKMAPFGDLFLW
jgi:hypothetical protein